MKIGNIDIADIKLGDSQVSAWLGGVLVWGGEEPVADTPFRFTILADDTEIDLALEGSGLEAPDLEFSNDNGAHWWQWVPGEVSPHENAGTVILVRAGSSGNSRFATDSSNYWHFTADDQFSVAGNIMMLLSRDGSTQMTGYSFSGLFKDCTTLVDASGLELPAMTLASNCYSHMFQGCTSLSAAPELPATTIASGCYYGMFNGCQSLTTAPVLSATTLAGSCYSYMFSGCSSLSVVPDLSATALKNYCCQNMFENCTSLTKAPALPATKPAGFNFYQRMFKGCSNLSSMNVGLSAWSYDGTDSWLYGVAASGTFTCPAELPDERGTSRIPTGWTVVKPPELLCFTAEQANSTVRLDKVVSPNAISLETSTDGSSWTDYSWTNSTGDTLTLANVGDKVYFRAKTENQTIGTNSGWYTFVMTGKIAASGNIQTLLKADGSRTDAPANCYYGMFNGCTSLTTAPELPATTLASGCYTGMFQECQSLTTAPVLSATALADGCYFGMFKGCTSLTTAPALPATALAIQCYDSMFRDCSSLSSAPALPATTLSSNCYQEMFRNCSSLNSVKVPFTAWSPSTATTNWLSSVAASGTFTCPAELSDIRDDSHIPVGWTVVNPPQELGAVCFTAEQANSTVKLYKYNSGAPTLDIETSTDGSIWSAYTQGTVLTAANIGDTIYFRAGSTGNSTMSNSSNTNRFAITGKMAASGDIQYLLSQDGTTQPTTSWCFNCLFYGQSGLTKAPKCGATSTLQAECYGGTFEQCRGLTEYVDTPLPQMWQDGATNLPHWTYINMFKNCNNLSAIAVNWTSWPMESSSTGANPGWLNTVASTGVFYCPSSLPDKYGDYGIPNGWTRVNI